MSTTRDRILEAAAELLRAGGPTAVTFDAVAARLGLTKQAVIYWFPTKADLFAGVALPILEAEARAAVEAARSAAGRADAARRVVAELTRFHLSDLERFRLAYVAPQLDGASIRRARIADRVHPVTAEMYGTVAEALGGGPEARAEAVALHMAALGHALLVALTEAAGDPLRHGPGPLADVLARLLADGTGPVPPDGGTGGCIAPKATC